MTVVKTDTCLVPFSSQVTFMLVINNAMQGILSSFFFKFADTILKKYSSTIATIFSGLMSALLFGHTLTLNFVIGVSIVFISMHLFFSLGTLLALRLHCSQLNATLQPPTLWLTLRYPVLVSVQDRPAKGGTQSHSLE